MKRILKKLLKIVGVLILLFLIVVYILFYTYTSPVSDEKVFSDYKEAVIKPIISKEQFKNFTYRKVTVQKDTALPTIVFIHGTIGSVTNFSRYMADSILSTKANMITYDRIGYNYNENDDVQESIAFEVEMLEDVIKDIPLEKLIIAGYSYGGPIALASKKKYKKVVLLAPAVYSKVEPMPVMLNFYKWRLTRWLVPPIWKQASKEKISHPKDLQKFEKSWNTSPSNIVSLHGDQDWIVPFSNSEYLKGMFTKDQFKLIVLKDAGHDLIWSNFEEIKNHLLSVLH